MTKMIEVYYPVPEDFKFEQKIRSCIEEKEGRVSYKEVDERKIVLTVEFEKDGYAEQSKKELEELGVHIEGPADY